MIGVYIGVLQALIERRLIPGLHRSLGCMGFIPNNGETNGKMEHDMEAGFL